jgi:hypothetical protein
MSEAMLAFTLGYLLARPERAAAGLRPGDAAAAARALDWRLLAALCAPLAVLTADGKGYNNGTAAGPGTALTTDVAATFFVILAVLAAAGFLLRHGTRWFLPVLAAQSLLLAVAGERSPVIMAAVALVLVLLRAGARVPTRQVTAAALLIALAVLAITGARVQAGRGLFYDHSGADARLGALASGLSSSAQDQPGPGGGSLLAQATVRDERH